MAHSGTGRKAERLKDAHNGLSLATCSGGIKDHMNQKSHNVEEFFLFFAEKMVLRCLAMSCVRASLRIAACFAMRCFQCVRTPAVAQLRKGSHDCCRFHPKEPGNVQRKGKKDLRIKGPDNPTQFLPRDGKGREEKGDGGRQIV
eukprot:s520_g11.t1